MVVLDKTNTCELTTYVLSTNEKINDNFVWEIRFQNPSDEIIVSWSGNRPLKGFFQIQISVFITEWSSWFDYACWASDEQYTFEKTDVFESIKVYQDMIKIINEKHALKLKVRVIAHDEASLSAFDAFHVSAIDTNIHAITLSHLKNISINLDVKGISQMVLLDKRCARLCSPTSIIAVMKFLSKGLNLSPLTFADSVYDKTFDIYGNWILNTAAASSFLGDAWHVFVCHLSSFDQIIDQLKKGYPVVVSIQGPLNKSAASYDSGHLLVVKGFDSRNEKILCMDPAFLEDELTSVAYDLKDFIIAWQRRKGLAYLFVRRSTKSKPYNNLKSLNEFYK